MPSQHVLFIVNRYRPDVGGVETHVENLAKNLVKLGNKATVVTLGEQNSEFMLDGVRVITRKPLFRKGPQFAWPDPQLRTELRSIFVGNEITQVSVHTRFFPMSWLGRKVAIDLAIPSIHTEHGSNFVSGVDWLTGVVSRAVDFTLGRNHLRRVDKLLAISDESANFVRRLSGRKSEVFYNAIDEQIFQINPTRQRNIDFVFLGRLVQGKGWDSYLEAIHQISQNERKGTITASVIGDGPQRALLLERINKFGLEDIITWRGQLQPSQVAEDLNSSHVFVNPTTLSEGFQTTLIEALSMGCYIVTSQVPGAEQLGKESARISILKENFTVSDLSTEMLKALEASLADSRLERPFDVTPWSWAQRSKEFLKISSEAVQ